MLRVLLFRGHALPAEAELLLIALSWMTQKVEHLGRDCRNGRFGAVVSACWPAPAVWGGGKGDDGLLLKTVRRRVRRRVGRWLLRR